MFTFLSHITKAKLLILLCGLSLMIPAQAEWYSATGRAAIRNNDVETARREAVDDAVRSTLLEAGASITVYQDFRNGTLNGERVELNANLPVKRVTVMEEQRTLNAVQVRVRVYIDNDEITRCPLSAIKKTVLPLTFHFDDTVTYSGSYGLESMTTELSDLIYNRLGASDALLLAPQRKLNFFKDKNSGLSYDEIRNLDALSRQENVHYVITGTIRSLALSDAGPSIIDKLLYSKTRRLDFAVSVFDAVTGQVILRRTYEAETDWDYKQGDFVDIRSERFLSSSYGQRLLELANFAVEDIIASLQCAPASSRVIATSNDNIIISIGQNVGLKVGQEFTLYHISEMLDWQGKFNRISQESGTKYKVTEVFSHSASLQPSGGSRLINVSAGDVVTLQ